MSKSIFISHVHEDNKHIEKLESWAANGDLGNVKITKETEDYRHIGQSAIKRHIHEKIKGSAAVLILVGKDTHNHDWIRVEVELANNYNKKIVCARIPGTRGSRPKILNNYNEVDWNAEALKKAIHG